MEGSEDGERRARRTGIVIGVLAALVIALAVALVIALSGDESGQSDSGATTPTATTAPTTPPTQTTATTTEPTTTTTTTTAPGGPTIDQVQAKQAAARGAAVQVERYGITIPPSGWDARCTALGGRDQAPSWTCQVAANSGQCSGTITAFARGPGVPGTRNPQIACGE